GDFEHTSDPFDELHLFRTEFHKPRPRTEGPWFIVSRHAVFDSDLHSRHLRGKGNDLILSPPGTNRHCRSRSHYPLRLPACRIPSYMSLHDRALLGAALVREDTGRPPSSD